MKKRSKTKQPPAEPQLEYRDGMPPDGTSSDPYWRVELLNSDGQAIDGVIVQEKDWGKAREAAVERAFPDWPTDPLSALLRCTES